MFVVSVTVWVKPGREQEFIAATLQNARATRGETGNFRFDVNQSNDDPTRFLLYEVYRDPEAFKTHQQTDHYLAWRTTVEDWMKRKREGIKHFSIFPETDKAWIAD